jgi:hypothetical protein
MLRSVARFTAPLTAAACAMLAWLGGCGGSDVTLAETYEAGPPSLVSADAAAVEEEVGLTSYCPSSKCPAGFTTCDNSRFPCDVDLLRDRTNCGECGHACPPGSSDPYECIEGRCVLKCGSSAFDCDGFNENGCETSPGSNDNCSACGDRCLDPAKPCVDRNFPDGDFGCGCEPGRAYCNGGCVDPKTDNDNCGACGNVCSRNGDGGTPPTNGYFGCVDSQCGRAKCNNGYADCDGDPSNGCEAALDTTDNCAACGNTCGAGQECKNDILKGAYDCACPDGQTWCDLFRFGSLSFGTCVDLSSDPSFCGGCGVSCAREAQLANSANLIPVCSSGVCTLVCPKGKADCNGNLADDCEVNTKSDPRNCGACGSACDAVAGQACVGGRCVVEPCEQTRPDGEEAR